MKRAVYFLSVVLVSSGLLAVETWIDEKNSIEWEYAGIANHSDAPSKCSAGFEIPEFEWLNEKLTPESATLQLSLSTFLKNRCMLNNCIIASKEKFTVHKAGENYSLVTAWIKDDNRSLNLLTAMRGALGILCSDPYLKDNKELCENMSLVRHGNPELIFGFYWKSTLDSFFEPRFVDPSDYLDTACYRARP